MKVKICGLTNGGDAAAAAELGADFLGFVFAPSLRRLPLELALEFWGDLPEGVPRVGVFKDQSQDEVEAAVGRLDLDCLQFHGAESPQFCRSFGRPVIRAWSARCVDDLDGLEAFAETADYYLVDLPKETAFEGRLPLEVGRAAARLRRPTLLAGGLDAENVAAFVRELRPWGVDVARGVESAPGKKDRAKMERFFRQLREADGGGKGGGR